MWGEEGEGGKNVWGKRKMLQKLPLPAMVCQWCVTCLRVADRTCVGSRMVAGRTLLARHKGEGAGGRGVGAYGATKARAQAMVTSGRHRLPNEGAAKVVPDSDRGQARADADRPNQPTHGADGGAPNEMPPPTRIQTNLPLLPQGDPKRYVYAERYLRAHEGS